MQRDTIIFDLINQEKKRQIKGIELILKTLQVQM